MSSGLTASESILFWFANVVGYLDSASIAALIPIEVEVGPFVESMGCRPWRRGTEIVMYIGKAV